MIERLLIADVAVASFLVHRHYEHRPDYDYLAGTEVIHSPVACDFSQCCCPCLVR